MKTYRKGSYFYIELPESQLDDFDDDLEKLLNSTIAVAKFDIVLDLKNISYLSSFTLRIIINYHKKAVESGHSLSLLNIDSELRKFVAASRLDAILPIFSNEGEMALSEKASSQLHSHHECSTDPSVKSFSFSTRTLGEAIVADMCGTLDDASQLRDLEEELIQELKNGRLKFIINMERLTFIDSLSTGRIVKLNRFLIGRNGKLAFCCVHELVEDFFAVLGLTDLLATFQTESDALKSLE